MSKYGKPRVKVRRMQILHKIQDMECSVAEDPDKDSVRRKCKVAKSSVGKAKKCYQTKEEALLALAQVQKKFKLRGMPVKNLHPFPCEFCDSWHLGRHRKATAPKSANKEE